MNQSDFLVVAATTDTLISFVLALLNTILKSKSVAAWDFLRRGILVRLDFLHLNNEAN